MFEAELTLAKSVARTAGSFLKSSTEKHITSQEGKDIKLELDVQTEALIKKEISLNSPYPILGEESGLECELCNDGFLWIIDPIDGTMNFSREIPIACISIALWQNNEPILGVIYDFYRDELFSAIVGEVRAAAKPKERSQAILATGFPVYMKNDADTLTQFIQSVQEYKKIRMIGSAALSLAYVSCGRFDAYMENSIKLWDVAAGIALCRAAHIETKYSFIDSNYTMNVYCGIK